MVVLEAKGTSLDGLRPASKCLVVKSGIRNRPIEVSACQGLSSVAAIV